MVAAGWSEAQKRAYVLADDQLAITGSGWDPELLRLELGEPRRSGRFARRSDATERWSIDRLIPYAKKRTDPHGGAGRRDRREHQGVGLDDAGAGGRGWRPDCGPRQDTRRPAARHQAPTLPLPRRARARARDGDGNQRPWPADKTEDNLLRQVVYEGLREDKPPKDVRRPIPHPRPAR